MPTLKRSSKRIAAAGTAVFLVVALLASVATAIVPEQTREGYAAQVEPICKKNTQANERILQGVRKKVKNGQLSVAASQFAKAAAAFEKAVGELRGVQQPVSDGAKLTKWLKQLDAETALLRNIGGALKKGDKVQAQAYSVRLAHNGNLANNLTLGFDFHYCLIDSSKFS